MLFPFGGRVSRTLTSPASAAAECGCGRCIRTSWCSLAAPEYAGLRNQASEACGGVLLLGVAPRCCGCQLLACLLLLASPGVHRPAGDSPSTASRGGASCCCPGLLPAAAAFETCPPAPSCSPCGVGTGPAVVAPLLLLTAPLLACTPAPFSAACPAEGTGAHCCCSACSWGCPLGRR